MVGRPGDTTPRPPGGPAAERLKMFEQARRPPTKPAEQSQSNEAPAGQSKPKKLGVRPDEEPQGCSD